MCYSFNTGPQCVQLLPAQTWTRLPKKDLWRFPRNPRPPGRCRGVSPSRVWRRLCHLFQRCVLRVHAARKPFISSDLKNQKSDGFLKNRSLTLLYAGDEIYHYNVRTKVVDEKEFKDMPNCTSAFRFMEHFYCFHGHMFSKFDPKTGEVQGKYPKEARDYFMRCAKFSKCFISHTYDILFTGIYKWQIDNWLFHQNPGEFLLTTQCQWIVVALICCIHLF